jgi:dienelactone hydrolase
LYDWHKDACQLIDCTLSIHAKDLDAVVDDFCRKGFKKIYVAGHSFGGPMILLSKKQKFDAAVLWDPSYDVSFTRKKYGVAGGKYVKSLDGYFMRWWANVVLSRRMVREVDELDWDSLTPAFRVPLKVVTTGKGVLVDGCRRYIAQAHAPKHLEIIRGATHYFDDTPIIQHRLFKATQTWFEKKR